VGGLVDQRFATDSLEIVSVGGFPTAQLAHANHLLGNRRDARIWATRCRVFQPGQQIGEVREGSGRVCIIGNVEHRLGIRVVLGFFERESFPGPGERAH
jgi:hypothetical protein